MKFDIYNTRFEKLSKDTFESINIGIKKISENDTEYLINKNKYFRNSEDYLYVRTLFYNNSPCIEMVTEKHPSLRTEEKSKYQKIPNKRYRNKTFSLKLRKHLGIPDDKDFIISFNKRILRKNYVTITEKNEIKII